MLRENSLGRLTLQGLVPGREPGATADYFPSESWVGGGWVGATTVQHCNGQEWFSETGRKRETVTQHSDCLEMALATALISKK